MTSSSSGTVTSSSRSLAAVAVEPTVGQADLDRAVGVAALDPLATGDEPRRRIEVGEHVFQLAQRG